jgi:hypothetical protein
MPALRLRNVAVPSTEAAFGDGRIEDDRTVRRPDGSLVYVLNVPAVRSWESHGGLADVVAVEWSLTKDADGIRLLAGDDGAEADLLELGPEAAAAFTAEDHEPLTVIPSFKPLGHARDLGEYLLAGRVLTGVEQRKKPVDSISLSLYRIARLRGGPVWSAVAEHVAGVAATRIDEIEGDRLVHDTWGAGETHVRYVNDVILLMVAHAELTGEERWKRAAERACDLLEQHFTADVPGGRWILHDSIERDAARVHWVLNTHLQGVIALHAAGRDVRPHLSAADRALASSAGGAAGIRASAGLAAAENLRAWAPARYAGRRIGPAYSRAGRICKQAGALRLPGGWIARDRTGKRKPGRYLTVNLGDLAGVIRGVDGAPAILERRLGAALRFARASGLFRAELREGSAAAGLIPTVYDLAGDQRRATAAVERARAAGLHPMVGWPGYEGRLWSRLGEAAPL